jgi:hypothetical protein
LVYGINSGNLLGFDTQQETLLDFIWNSRDVHETEIETRVYPEEDTGKVMVRERERLGSGKRWGYRYGSGNRKG